MKTDQTLTKQIETNYGFVFNQVMRFTRGDRALAEDVTQEAAFHVIKKIHTLRDPENFRAWFAAIALNIARNDFRRSKWRVYDTLESVPPKPAPKDFEAEYFAREMLARLAPIVATLPPKQHQAFELRVVEGLSFLDVAEIMNCPYDTAKANCRHALHKLRRGQ